MPIVMAFLTALTSSAFAKETLLIDRSVALHHSPRAAYFIVLTEDGELSKHEAVIEAAAGKRSMLGSDSVWLFGTLFEYDSDYPTIQYALVVLTEENNFINFEPVTEEVTRLAMSGQSADSVREKLLESKKMLHELDARIKTQRNSLDRLRADAEVIGSLGRIADVIEETDRVKADLARLEKDSVTLQQSVKIANAGPQPSNFARRQSELTLQIEELAQAARSIESDEGGRKVEAEAKFHDTAELLDEARNSNYDELYADLVQLRKRRMQLEQRSGQSADIVDDYQDFVHGQ